MRLSFTFWAILTSLLLLGGWGLLKIAPLNNTNGVDNETATQTVKKTRPPNKRNTAIDTTTKSTPEKLQSDFEKALSLLQQNKANYAAQLINDRHSYLSTPELTRLKQAFMTLASSQQGQIKQQKNTLIAASQVFDDLDIWILVANSAANDEDWELAHKAHRKASILENSPENLEHHLKRLLFSASKLRTIFEQTGDEFSIKALYQELNNLHPNHSRFQLELALAHLRLNNTEEAVPLLNSLSYDPEYGNIAKNALTKIRASQAQSAADQISSIKPSVAHNEITLPLIPSGSSFLIDVGIDHRNTRLLLDTGASITALSSTLISRLNLKKTGQVIRISTANGVKDSALYRIERLAIGQLVITNMIVAEIDLAANNRFEGLLGTDALSQFENYNYLIDNQRKVLIFKSNRR